MASISAISALGRVPNELVSQGLQCPDGVRLAQRSLSLIAIHWMFTTNHRNQTPGAADRSLSLPLPATRLLACRYPLREHSSMSDDTVPRRPWRAFFGHHFLSLARADNGFQTPWRRLVRPREPRNPGSMVGTQGAVCARQREKANYSVSLRTCSAVRGKAYLGPWGRNWRSIGANMMRCDDYSGRCRTLSIGLDRNWTVHRLHSPPQRPQTGYVPQYSTVRGADLPLRLEPPGSSEVPPRKSGACLQPGHPRSLPLLGGALPGRLHGHEPVWGREPNERLSRTEMEPTVDTAQPNVPGKTTSSQLNRARTGCICGRQRPPSRVTEHSLPDRGATFSAIPRKGWL